ncbi:MAG TPA: amino acid adenylation domain-containing protein [Herpetosiphonaceae bacterium]
MSDLAKLLADLSPEQQELFRRRLHRLNQETRADSRPPIRPQSRETNMFPLSFSQQRLWFLDQLEPGNPFYNEPLLAIRLSGPLDLLALQQALDAIMRRHEVVRTTFALVDGQPVQVINPPAPFPLATVDLRALAPAEREAEVQRLAVAEANRPFDLQHGPLMRVTVVRLDAQQHTLLLMMHHIVSDGWSFGVFMRELTTLYAAFTQGAPVEASGLLPELPVQYADFAAWQRQWLQGEVLDQQLSYWRRQLADVPPLLELPADHPRPPIQTFRGAHYAFEIGPELTASVRALAQREGATLFMTLLAAFQTLLHRYTDLDDIVVGSPIAGRTQVETEHLIGFFANHLVLRADLRGDPSFRELLARVRQMTLDAHAHQDVPFEMLVEQLQPSRDLSHNPLVQVVFVLQNLPLQSLTQSNLTFDLSSVESETSKFDLTLSINETEQLLAATLEYSTDLFEAATIERMARHFAVLLAGIVADPGRRVSALPLLAPDEQQELVGAWNATRRPFPDRTCLHTLFEEQVVRTPDAIAALQGEQHLTYAELNRRANQVAHTLQARGVGPNVAVAICVERSLEMVLGLMGILKAGGAYLPLDPAYPQERLQFMLEDGRVTVLLTQQHLLRSEGTRLPTDHVQVLCLDADWPVIERAPGTNPACAVSPADLVYVIYTSGSTGRPKGVLLDHRGRVNNFHDFNTRFAVGPGDRLLALSSLSFDMCAYDVFGTLAAGATIVLPEAALERDPAHWAALLVQQQVTIWHSVPALLDVLAEYVHHQPDLHPRALRLVLLGGDWIPVSLPDRLRALVPTMQVISLGGATEASMDSTIYAVERTDPRWKSIPYGQPMTNQRAYVLDRHQRLVPIGVPGELHLGGIGLAWGYQGRPDLTAEKFIPSPYEGCPQGAPGARLYKTGDRARYRADGQLELLGRIDYQVKIRGLRIELGEIEAALRQHPAVREAVVVARDEGGQKRLVAYVVEQQNGHPLGAQRTNGEQESNGTNEHPENSERAMLPSDLRAFLQTQLPEHMVPSALVVLDALPLTPNGKVNRRELPAPSQVLAETQAAYAAPQTATQQTLADIWAELLGLERVGVHENFFTLGGDSIRSIQVIARASQRGIALTPKQCFQHQTIAELAAAVDAARGTSADESPTSAVMGEQASPVQRDERSVADGYALGPMQENMLFHSLHHPQPGLYVVQRSFPLPKNLNLAALEQAWQHIVERHAMLRTTFVWQDLEQPRQVAHAPQPIALEHYDWRGMSVAEQETQMERFFEAERARGFDLAAGPLLRLALIRLSDDVYQFAMLNHYAILDGWSESLVRKEVLSAYIDLCAGRTPSASPARPYRDYIAWLERQDQAAAETFWRQMLRSFPTPTPLPKRDAGALAGDGHAYRKQGISVSAATTAALHALARSHQLTLNIVVQGAWALLLSQCSGTEDIVFGVTFSGRPATLADIEAMVGLFINTLPVRAHVSAGAELLPWLKAMQAQQVEMRAYEYAALPRIQAWSEVPQDQRLFESVLVFDNYPVDSSVREAGASLDLSHPLALKDYSLAQTEFPIRVDIWSGAELRLLISFYERDFEAATIDWMLERFKALLEQIAAQPEQRLGAFRG